MDNTREPTRWLSMVLLLNLAASMLHFGDNVLRFHEYPEPAWITGPHVVDALWFVMTPLLGLGWFLARRGRRRAAVGVLRTYGVASMLVLGHYLYASPRSLSPRVNFFILLEASAAALLILTAPVLSTRRPARAAN